MPFEQTFRLDFSSANRVIAMSLLHSKVFRHYALGLVCTFVGAWGTAVTESMLPLALGAAASILATVPLVQQIWLKRSARRSLP